MIEEFTFYLKRDDTGIPHSDDPPSRSQKWIRLSSGTNPSLQGFISAISLNCIHFMYFFYLNFIELYSFIRPLSIRRLFLMVMHI